MRRSCRASPRGAIAALLGFVLVGVPASARADATVFLAVDSVPRPVLGVSVGRNPGTVGFEVEYAGAIGSPNPSSPSASTVTVNLVIQKRLTARVRWYGVGGIGAYGESRGEGRGSTDVVYGVGAGAKIGLAGRIDLRLDYRLFLLDRSADAGPIHAQVHRWFAGLNIAL